MKEDLYTGGIPNGHWIEENTETIVDIYILGLHDGMYAKRGGLNNPVCLDNPTLNRENIVEVVRLYYEQSPENKFRQISAVIRSGCR